MAKKKQHRSRFTLGDILEIQWRDITRLDHHTWLSPEEINKEELCTIVSSGIYYTENDDHYKIVTSIDLVDGHGDSLCMIPKTFLIAKPRVVGKAEIPEKILKHINKKLKKTEE